VLLVQNNVVKSASPTDKLTHRFSVAPVSAHFHFFGSGGTFFPSLDFTASARAYLLSLRSSDQSVAAHVAFENNICNQDITVTSQLHFRMKGCIQLL
jgi:hypothetical protein